jgi:hypothetical protein
MRVPFVVRDLIDWLRDLGPHQLLVRSLLVGGGVLTVVATEAAGEWSWVAPTITLAVVAWAAIVPDSGRPLAALLVMVGGWVLSVDDSTGPWSLLAALGLLTVHSAAAWAAETPDGGRVGWATRARWGQWAAIVASLTVAVWGLTEWLSTADAPGRAILAGSALIGVMALTIGVGRRAS